MTIIKHACPICHKLTRWEVNNYPQDKFTCDHGDDGWYRATFKTNTTSPQLINETYSSANRFVVGLDESHFTIQVNYVEGRTKLIIHHAQAIPCPIKLPDNPNAEEMQQYTQQFMAWAFNNPIVPDETIYFEKAISIPKVLAMKGFW